MKKLVILFLWICLWHVSPADSWTQKADFGGIHRYAMAGFSIGNLGYFGTGVVGNYFSDLWEYNPATDAWTQKSSFPGTDRAAATGFSIGNKGYIGCGSNSLITAIYYFDFYEWDQLTNTWTIKAGFPYTRSGAVGFSIGNKGYIGTGYSASGYADDLWEWDPITDQWIQKASLPGSARSAAVAFAIGNDAYVGAGRYLFSNYLSDFWKWNQSTDTWTQVASIPGLGRCCAVAFAINNKGYVGTGLNTLGQQNDFWQYDPLLNSWQPKAPFGGVGRDYASGLTIGNKGYIGMGHNINTVPGDFWEYDPDSTTGISDLEITNYDFQITPNPATDFIKILLNENQQQAATAKITIADVVGKKVYSSTITNNEMVIDVKCFAKGVYSVGVGDEKKSAVKKFLKN